jgi:uncharacterized membrane protein (UPF0182 family)
MAWATAAYFVRGAIAFGEQGPALDSQAFGHLSVVGAGVLLCCAARLWLGRYQLLVSKRGAVFGAGYTDIHAQLGAYAALAIITIGVAAWLATNAFLRKRPANLYILVCYLVLWALLGTAYPWAIQTFVVRPNEWECESPYVARNIEFTRKAYGLDAVRVEAWPGEAPLTPEALSQHRGTRDNLQIWDPGPLLDVYNQKQRIRSYYAFSDVDVDRYWQDGTPIPVMVGARELAPDGLPEKSKVWTNLHLQYTHGYGLCMSPGHTAAPGGLPDFLVRNIPPDTEPDFGMSQPRIYYGERTPPYALTSTRLDEFDYPGDPQNFFHRYEGTGGIPVRGLFRRAVLSWFLGDKEILFTNQFTDESRILLFRQVRDRAMRLAPFLYFDADPYPVLFDGGIVWMLDAYTLTNRFPYSETIGIANYWRNAAKVTVDAYDGAVRFYLADKEDPIARLLDTAFPGLFRPLEEMPAELRRHIRYPKDLFRVQTTIYRRYHVDDAQVFFNGEDVWTFPRSVERLEAPPGPGPPLQGHRGNLPPETYEPPRYMVMELPSSGGRPSQAEFVLARTFTVEGKDNMIGWMAARCDGEAYGELHLLRLPKRRNVYGPNQAKGRFNQDPEVSAFTTLMGQLGSTIRSSKVLAIPVADGLLYLQSLYIEDPAVRIPELKQVVLGHGDRVVMAPTVDEALHKLLSSPEQDAAAVSVSAAKTAGQAPDPAVDDKEEERVADLYLKARERLKAGDWAGFGEAFDALGRELGSTQNKAIPRRSDDREGVGSAENE